MPSGFEIAGKNADAHRKKSVGVFCLFMLFRRRPDVPASTRARVFAGSKTLGRAAWVENSRRYGISARYFRAPGRRAGCLWMPAGRLWIGRRFPVRPGEIPIRANARNALACFSGRSIRKAATSCRSGLRRV